jgi:uroporphyrinogen-III synthase
MTATVPTPGAAIAPPPLAGWQVFTLRPAGQARELLAGLRRAGAQATNLALVRLRSADPAALAEPLARLAPAQAWLFTSPAAARSCARLAAGLGLDLFAPGGTLARAAARAAVFAPGPGTARTLAALGVSPVAVPVARLDSEGLLALPALTAPLHGTVVLVGAPGGRGLLERELAARGARVEPLHVYRRLAAVPSPRSLQALTECPRPMLLASSGEMLQRLCAVLAPDRLDRLRADGQLVVASARLQVQARDLGFDRSTVAGSAQPRALVEAAIALARALDSAAGQLDSVSMAP